MTTETKKQKRDTVGKIAQELKKAPGTDSLAEQGDKSSKKYMPTLFETALDYSKVNPNIDFFIEVQRIAVPLFDNVRRNKFIARLSCPTPNYDQTVWHYKYKDNEVFLVWTIPDRYHCFKLLENAAIIDPSIRELTNNVIAFANGDLYRLCKKLNNEEELESLVVLKETQDDGREQSRPSKPIVSPAGSAAS